MKRMILPAALCVVALVGLSHPSVSLAPWMTESPQSQTNEQSSVFIERLASSETSQEAIAMLIKGGDASVPDLSMAARTHDSMAVRGWAIHGLAGISSGKAHATLQELSRDSDAPMLTRTWAWAALIGEAQDLEELGALAKESRGFPALARPLRLRVQQLVTEDSDVDGLLSLTSVYPALSDVINPILLKKDSREFSALLMTGSNDIMRRTAAGFLATQARSGGKQEVAEALMERVWFSRRAQEVPWKGGALFVPSIQWDAQQARTFVGELVAWFVFCEKNGLTVERQQIINNLRSVGLVRAAGFRHLGGNASRMLREYGRVAGRSALESILVRTGTETRPEFAQILRELG